MINPFSTMTTLEQLEGWRQAGIIDDAQWRTLSALVRKDRFSLFFELNGLLYLGVLALAGGLGWTFRSHFESLGDVLILSVLSISLAVSVYYCWSKSPSYSNQEVESPNFVVDYALYLACLLLSIELGYLKFRFGWPEDFWDSHLLFSSAVFFVLAYRFDNRFVLSLALASLAGWFGLTVSKFGFVSSAPLRVSALAYASITAIVGAFLYRQGIKKHFLEIYLHIAANVTFLALISGLFGDNDLFFLAALLLVSAVSVVLGVRFTRFAFVVYGIAFGYAGISMEVLQGVNDSGVLAYFVFTGIGAILLIAYLARRFGRED